MGIKDVISWHILPGRRYEGVFDKVKRIDFLPDDYKGVVFVDRPIPIGYGQTNSQPTTVAFMLEILQPQAGDRVLDVGSGSGWTTALLAEIVGEKGEVFGVELVPELVEFGTKNLEKYQFKHAQILQADKKVFGLSDEGPFDKILVSASAKKLPNELVDQLKVGGRLVIPIKNSIWRIDKLAKGNLDKEEYPGFVFVPLR